MRREVPEVLGRFTARETWLLRYIRDLEERIDRAEACLRIDSNQIAKAITWPDGRGED